MKQLLIKVGLLLLTSCASLPPPEMVERHTHADVQGVKKTLASITIPQACLKQVTSNCAVTFWISATRESDPLHRGVSAICQDGANSRVSIDATNISSLDLLNEICGQAHLRWWLTKKCLMIKAQNETGPEPGATPNTHSPSAQGVGGR